MAKNIKKAPPAGRQTPSHLQALKHEIAKQMLTLSTSAFGLVAALAWNQVIQELITTYIKPFVGGASGIISLLIYAVLVTLLAVLVTYLLTVVVKKD